MDEGGRRTQLLFKRLVFLIVFRFVWLILVSAIRLPGNRVEGDLRHRGRRGVAVVAGPSSVCFSNSCSRGTNTLFNLLAMCRLYYGHAI